MKKGKTFVMGDIHGGYKALIQCLERSGFDKKKDTLIQLGDVADGWSETYECVEELLTIKNLISIKGNHDQVFEHSYKSGHHIFNWSHGALATAWSYSPMKHNVDKNSPLLPDILKVSRRHRNFFKNQRNYYIDSSNRLFVHGGYDKDESIYNQDDSSFLWNRKLWTQAMSCKDGKLNTIDCFSEIFIGHTPTLNWYIGKLPIVLPMNSGGVWNLDTGCGFFGRLTIMDVETKQYWQSDDVKTLYPDERGRG